MQSIFGDLVYFRVGDLQEGVTRSARSARSGGTISKYCAAGAVLGAAIGVGSRAVGEIYGLTTTMAFNIGARAALGAVSGKLPVWH